MADSYPAKSRIVYLKAFKQYEQFLKSRNQFVADAPPTEIQMLNYFHYLRQDRKWAPTTLWSHYARINACIKRKFGFSMKTFVRVSDALKSYESGHHVKKAAIFSPQEIEDFVTDSQLSSRYWLVRKVICLVGYFGGFRSIELKSLVFENVEMDEMGYWFTFSRSKQRSMVEDSSICVPRRLADWSPCSNDVARRAIDYDPASLLDLYYEQLCLDYQCTKDELCGPFFKSTHGVNGKRFIQGCIGKNTLGQVGVEIAQELLLSFPETYTGHCWRRSAGTNASNNGVNVTTLMSMMGWACPKTAMEYVKHSRITSLTMSMYLANVQRQNIALPFPSTASERVRKTVFSTKKLDDLKFVSSELDFEKDASNLVELGGGKGEKYSASQDMFENDNVVCDKTHVKQIECAKNPVSVGENESLPSVMSENLNLSTIDSRLGVFLPNFQNQGTVNFHFHFNEKK